MKILYIAHTSAEGGSSIALLNIIKGMLSRNVELAVVCPEKEGYLVTQLQLLKVKSYIATRRYEGYHVYPTIEGYWKRISYLVKDFLAEKRGERFLKSVIKEYQPDLVHTNSSACIIGFNVCKSMGVKHIWHIREYLDIGFGWTPKPSANAHKKRLQSLHTYNIAITKAIYDYYEMKEPHEYIYDGVIDTEIPDNPQNEMTCPYFLFVGALTKNKGIDVAIRQFLAFHKTNNTHHLVVIGSTKDQALIRELTDEVQNNAAGEFVHWLGQRNDVYSWMYRATALIVPSINEGFGFITVEGMYCNTIVIGRDTAGTKEQFDKGLKDTGNEIALRFIHDESIPQLMNRSIIEDLSLMKENARNVVLNNYTIEANTDKLYRFYEKVLNL